MAWLVLVLMLPTPAALAQAAEPPLNVPNLPGLVTERPPSFTNLTLQPSGSLNTPPSLILGSSRRVDLSQPAGLRETPIERIAPPDWLDEVARVFDTQDVVWPTGTTASVHIQYNDGLKHWVPYVSTLFDVDDYDAHERYGAGVGATYRFTPSFRFDMEVQYLQNSDDINPALGDEVRGFALFTWSF